MKHKKLLIIATITTVLLSSLAFSGCHRHRSPEERITHKLDHVASHLDLNDQQKIKLGKVKDEILRARQELRQDHPLIFAELLAEIKDDQIDQTKIVHLIKQHHARLVKVAPPVIAKVAELHASLTPEQKAKAVKHLEWFREKMTKHNPDARM